MNDNRLETIRKAQKRVKAHKHNIPSPEIKTIISYWNNHLYMKNKPEHESKRNLLVTNEVMQNTIKSCNKVLKIIGINEISIYINEYLNACIEGKNIIDNRVNIGYKNLFSFMDKICRIEQGKDNPWWKENNIGIAYDKYPLLTEAVIKYYGANVLSNINYSVSNKSKEYINFVKTAERINNFINGNDGFTSDETIIYLLSCLKETNKPIYPGSLCSDFTWRIMFPQYIKNNLT